MGDRENQKKPEENYPLLTVEACGDMNQVKCHPTQIRLPSWGVTCVSKYPRFSRWPEFFSACWMTLILCGISFLIFYALGMGLYRRHQFIIMKCSNNSKPASNVFYHYIVPRGRTIPFLLYTEYLAYMSTQYPLLKFNVLFLTEDSYPDTLRGLKRNLPYYAYTAPRLDEIGKEVLAEFEKRYENVNVTIMPLSKYMATTSLRFKYRLIPIMHLPFYIRVLSVWQNGGIGMDLKKFNNDYHLHMTDPRVFAIMKQHNDGINPEDYSNAINKIEKEQDNALFTIFYGLVNHFLNETRSIFNKTLTPVSTEKNILIRTHRSKREINNGSDAADNNTTIKTKSTETLSINAGETVAENFAKKNQSLEITTSSPNADVVNETVAHNLKTDSNGSESRQIVFFYDFSIFSDVGPTYLLPLSSEPLNDPFSVPDFKYYPGMSSHNLLQSTKAPSRHLLSLDSNGNFIAASTKLHPFLGHLISVGCKRLPPKFAIQDTLASQCSGLYREDVYCNNIFIL